MSVFVCVCLVKGEGSRHPRIDNPFLCYFFQFIEIRNVRG